MNAFVITNVYKPYYYEHPKEFKTGRQKRAERRKKERKYKKF